MDWKKAREKRRSRESSRRYNFRLLDSDDRETVDAFFAQRPEMNISKFLRSCIMKGIKDVQDRELAAVLKSINEHQAKFGGDQVK